MATRQGKGRSKGSAHSDDSYEWSEWVWEEARSRYYRTRINSKGKYVYQYGVPQTASEAIPRSERSEAGSSATTTFSSVTANVDSEYHESQEYQFQEQRQTSSSFDDLSNDFAAVSIDPEQAPPSSSSYNQADAGDNPTVDPSDYQGSSTTLPIPIAPAASRLTTENDDLSSTPRALHMGSPIQRSITTRSEFVPGSSTTYSQGQQLQFATSPVLGSSSISNSYGSSATLRDYSGANAASVEGSEPSYDTPTAINTDTITPNDLASEAHMRITGTPGSSEPLDPNFKVHRSKYFKPGHIFKVLWPEPIGETANSSATDVTGFSWDVHRVKYKEKVYSSIRRFVIVKTDHGHSQCLPILTYQHKATTKQGVKREDHAIIYTGKIAPNELKGEARLVLRPVQVVPKTPRDKLETASRINYAKIYTVEHNVKVLFIGHIAPASEHTFVTDFDRIWRKKMQINPTPPAYPTQATSASQQDSPQANYSAQHSASGQQYMPQLNYSGRPTSGQHYSPPTNYSTQSSASGQQYTPQISYSNQRTNDPQYSSFPAGWVAQTNQSSGQYESQVIFTPNYGQQLPVDPTSDCQSEPPSDSVPSGSTDSQQQYWNYAPQPGDDSGQYLGGAGKWPL